MRADIRNASLQRAYDKAGKLPYHDGDKLVCISDLHRGVGNANDNFSHNQLLYFQALRYYYDHNYTYIELGDGDELWENSSQKRIVETYGNIFWLLSLFHREHRLYMLYGNHDNKKRKADFVRKHLSEYYNECTHSIEPLFPGLEVWEALRFLGEGTEIFMVHGHQGELLNDHLHVAAKWMVRLLWSPLERIGVKDPTSVAKNYARCNCTGRGLSAFAEKKKLLMICGHTHKPVCPAPKEGYYFNDGSGVHPRCITAIEVSGGRIALVKWALGVRRDGSLHVTRQILEGPHALALYTKNR